VRPGQITVRQFTHQIMVLIRAAPHERVPHSQTRRELTLCSAAEMEGVRHVHRVIGQTEARTMAAATVGETEQKTVTRP